MLIPNALEELNRAAPSQWFSSARMRGRGAGDLHSTPLSEPLWKLNVRLHDRPGGVSTGAQL